MEADVVIVGAGPTGLMLAAELGLAGVRPLVLEAHPAIRETAKAGGLSGQILDVLRHRGELARFEEASTAPRPAPRFPWGGLHIDLTRLAHSPMQALPLPQPRLEEVLDGLAREHGAEVRRGTEVVGLRQDAGAVTVEADGSRDHLPGGATSRRGGAARVRDGPRQRRPRDRRRREAQLRLHPYRAG